VVAKEKAAPAEGAMVEKEEMAVAGKEAVGTEEEAQNLTKAARVQRDRWALPNIGNTEAGVRRSPSMAIASSRDHRSPTTWRPSPRVPAMSSQDHRPPMT